MLLLFQNYYFVMKDHYFLILFGDGTSWISGKYCDASDGDWTGVIEHRDYSENPVKDLDAAKKECADTCDLNKDCKYGDIFWLPGEAQWCTFWTRDVCEMTENEFSYIYKKQ